MNPPESEKFKISTARDEKPTVLILLYRLNGVVPEEERLRLYLRKNSPC